MLMYLQNMLDLDKFVVIFKYCCHNVVDQFIF
jgi:hypothetical protein